MPSAASRWISSQKSRLVEQQQARLVQQAGGKRQALLPAARQRAGELVAPIGQAQRIERARHRLAPVRHPVHARDEVEVLGDRQVFPQREALRHVADVALDRRRLADHVVAEAGAAAAVRSQQAAHHADRRRLAAAVRAEEAEDLAVAHAQRQVDDDVPVAEMLVQAFDVDGEALVRPVGVSRIRIHRLARRDGPLAGAQRLAPPFGAPSSSTSTGCPGCRRAAAVGEGRASTRKTSFCRACSP